MFPVITSRLECLFFTYHLLGATFLAVSTTLQYKKDWWIFFPSTIAPFALKSTYSLKTSSKDTGKKINWENFVRGPHYLRYQN